MRVHDTRTGLFYDRRADDHPYAIFSHTWDATGEQSFQEVQRIQESRDVWTHLCMAYPTLLWFLATYLSRIFHLLADYIAPNRASYLNGLKRSLDKAVSDISLRISVLNDLRLSKKLREACAVARLRGFSQIWVDSSCIDRTNSSELSQSINSMFAWYRDAAVCYVYLRDVPFSSDHRRPGSAFRHSRWFTRGWTLQELVAPRIVIFLSQEWKEIGTKETLADIIADITGIHQDVLMHRQPFASVSVAARMSWAAERSTTHVEDQAYCLLGLFGIVMTPIYGEGLHAFRRLQEEILRRIPDDSIFAWECHVYDTPELSGGPQVNTLSSDTANPRNHLMRLLDTATGQFVDRPENSNTAYAVLSHVWDDDEVRHDDILEMQRNAARAPRLSRVALYFLFDLLHFLVRTLLHFLVTLVVPLVIPLLVVLCVLCRAMNQWNCTHIFLAFRSQDLVFLDNWTSRRWARHLSILDQLGKLSKSPKIRNACAVAQSRGLALIWIDSGCVDHGDRTKVRRTVTSAYAWVRDATECYVYLRDVPFSSDHRRPGSAFRSSQWFKRCWTLQELVAPRNVVFLSQEWKEIGTKENLADLIEDITGVDQSVLTCRKSVNEVSVADRIQWAANREARRVEDRAYSLLGILDITMTPRYGEDGWAFRRLREKILRRYPNEALSLSKSWEAAGDVQEACTIKLITAALADAGQGFIPSDASNTSLPFTLLAPSPRAFLFSGNVCSISDGLDFRDRLNTPQYAVSVLHREYRPSPFGHHTRFHLIPLPTSVTRYVEVDNRLLWYLVILSCEETSLSDQSHHLLARLCYALPTLDATSSMTLRIGEFSWKGTRSLGTLKVPGWCERRSLIYLPKRQDFASIPLNPPILKPVYIPHVQYLPHFGSKIDWFGTKPPETTKVLVQDLTKTKLNSRGYHVEYAGSGNIHTTDTISLPCSSIPFILRLKKGEHEAAFFLPVRDHPYDGHRYGWIVNDDDGNERILSCGVVTSSDSGFETLTATAPTLNPSSRSLEEVQRCCATRSEWKVGAETVRPKLHYIAQGQYDLHIDIIE